MVSSGPAIYAPAADDPKGKLCERHQLEFRVRSVSYTYNLCGAVDMMM